MLAKIWKKLLLAICIIACLFNITYKLVNRMSLEKVISSQPEGVDVRQILNITEEHKVVMDKKSVYDNTVTNKEVSNEPVEYETAENPEEMQEEIPDETETPEDPEPKESKGITVTDFIDRVIDGSFNN